MAAISVGIQIGRPRCLTNLKRRHINLHFTIYRRGLLVGFAIKSKLKINESKLIIFISRFPVDSR